MKIFTSRFIITSLLLLTMACQKSDTFVPEEITPESNEYYVLNIKDFPTTGKILLNVNSYQQTTDYSCGPAAIISLLRFLGHDGNEMTIVNEMGTSTTTGTNPEQMVAWMNDHRFIASWHEEGSLELIRENLSNNIPTLIEWSDWGGHWVLVVGYDTRNNDLLSDDVIIFADPYDYHDDSRDGLTWFNAERFYYMWYDARLFGRLMKRIYIDAKPK
ncbi:MAG: hypothetical protein HOO86_12315 [Bacteroidales bacterium]|nr:hypothetical protein [Bacteroidales bacterium]